MTEKLCTKCGRLNSAYARFCDVCGAQEFARPPAEQLQDASGTQGAVANAAVRISMTRIVVLSAFTFSGLYFYYWLYLTWKQLRGETRDVHYPVWHAFTMFVPVYGLFRLHKHVGVVQTLALGAGVNTSLTAGLAVVLIALTWVLGIVSMNAVGLLLILLNLISFALTTTTMVWVQGALNAYWYQVRGTSLQNAPVGVGEKAIVSLGVLLWLNVLFSLLWD